MLGDTHPTCRLPRKGFAGCRVPHCPHTAPRQQKQRKEPQAWLRWERAAWSHVSVTQIRSTGTASQFTPALQNNLSSAVEHPLVCLLLAMLFSQGLIQFSCVCSACLVPMCDTWGPPPSSPPCRAWALRVI